MDETYFIFNMDDSKTLGLLVSANVNYVDVVGGADVFTLLLRLRGCRNAKLMNPFIRFKNRERNCPMINLPDDIPVISYRTQSRGWVDDIEFNAWLEEPHAINIDEMNRTDHLIQDECSVHKLTDAIRSAFEEIKTEVLLNLLIQHIYASHWTLLLFKN